MTLIAQMIADRLILRPSQHSISTTEKSRQMLPFGRGSIETWIQRVGTNRPEEIDVFVLKFSGTAGRAERATYHPLDYWTNLRAELWSVNPPGYGGSSGTASLKTLADAARCVYAEIKAIAADRPIVIMGNSLGTVSALYLASQFDVAGLILRNPPPLRQLIMGRHGWWNLWLGSTIISRKVPLQLCSIQNAQACRCPAVFLSSRQDETVPAIYQDKVIQAYGGPSRIVKLKEADHATSLNLVEQREYSQNLEWIRHAAIPVPAFDLSVTRATGYPSQFEDGRSSSVDRHKVTR
ncbi:MAG: alpha/beta hydrolase [Planctomycetaceae bacterium]|nr:alpha/beta hydrolase [Planctomycetaceae bacterium]